MLSETSRIPATPVLRSLVASRDSSHGKGLTEPTGEEPLVKKVGGLVLTRHAGESIMIGDEVEIQVVNLKSGSVRLKIVAPRSVSVHRREVFDAIQANPDARPAPVEAPAPSPRPGKPQGGLVLTRSPQQSIMIGDEVEIQVVEVRPAAVKLKVLAPRSITVHRREVFDAIRNGQA